MIINELFLYKHAGNAMSNNVELKMLVIYYGKSTQETGQEIKL